MPMTKRRPFCCASEHHARGLCRRQYDHWRRTGELDRSLCDRPDVAPAHVTMCGCARPVVGTGAICQRCARTNLAALLQARPCPSIVTPRVLRAAAVAGCSIRVL